MLDFYISARQHIAYMHGTQHPGICLPCANWSLITLVVVTYARLRVVISLFQPKDAPIRSSQLRRDRTVHLELSSSTAAQLPSYIRVRCDLKTELFTRAYH